MKTPTATPIPAVVKRNTLFIAASQVCSGMGTGLLPSLGALMVYRMLGNPALAGAASVIQGVTRFLIAYTVGSMADRYGRRPVIAAGLLAAAVGALLIGTAVAAGSFLLLIVAIIVFAAASNAVQQLRVAATDMYPPSRRGEGLGYVLTGSVAGSIGQAGLIAFASAIAVSLAVDPMALAWWMAPLVILPALVLVLQIRPDPKDIARNLAQYYPGEPSGPALHAADAVQRKTGSFWGYLKDRTILTVFIAMFGVQGNMSMTMVIAALTLADHGHDLTAIAVSSTLHSLGMFAFAIPQGKIADRYGRRPSMLAGILLAAAGTFFVALSGDYWIVTFGYFLVGFGWSAVFVAGTVLLADVSSPEERARLIGSNDTFAGAANTVLALIAGPVVGFFGVHAIVVVAVVLMATPTVMVLKLRPS